MMFYCVLRTELNAVCLYGLYRELETLLLFYYYTLLLLYIYSSSSGSSSGKIFLQFQF